MAAGELPLAARGPQTSVCACLFLFDLEYLYPSRIMSRQCMRRHLGHAAASPLGGSRLLPRRQSGWIGRRRPAAARRSNGRPPRPCRREAGAPPARQLLHHLAELVGNSAYAPPVAIDQAGDLLAERRPRTAQNRAEQAPNPSDIKTRSTTRGRIRDQAVAEAVHALLPADSRWPHLADDTHEVLRLLP